MRRRLFLLAAVTSGLGAQSGIAPPLAGYIRCEDGRLRPVYGIAGSFVLGAPVSEPDEPQSPPGSPDLSLPGGARLFSEENDLVCRQADGAETRVTLGAPAIRIERMGGIWIHVRTAGKSFAVRVSSGRIGVYRLPEVAE